jgi:diguanylate cyclase (GGDEF)-like protein
VKGILIKTGNGQVKGQFVSLRDITARKQSEKLDRRQHQFNEAMRNIAMTLTSTLNLDEVLDRILDSVSVVIPCTMINIMLVDEQHIAHVARFKGYLTAELIQLVTTVAFDVDNIPNLHLMETTGQPFIVPDILKVDYWQVRHSELRAYLGAPIQLKGRLFGFINLDHNHPDYFTEDDAANLKVFADLAAIAIENAHLFAKMNEMAEMDELTHISNRRHFFALADKEVRRSIRYDHNIVLVMMDIDCFKEINDTWGHQVGDTVLEKVSEIFRTSIREMDIAGRYGGDEFCILLPNAGEDDAVHFVERMTHQIKKIKIPGVHLAKKISISCGVAALTPADASLEDLLRKADLALYAAKLKGRDRIEKYNPA